MHNIVTQLFNHLDRAGMTNAEIARRLGIHAPRVSEWRNGAYQPSLDRIDQLANLAGVSLQWVRNSRR